MYNILTLNKISAKGLSCLDTAKYACFDECAAPDAVIVRSASMLDMELPSSLKSVARAGAGYNNIPVDRCTEKGICVFNTPGANANAVKELTICALLLASRNVAGGVKWTETLEGDDEISKKVEKGKSQFAGPEIMGKTLGVYGLGAIGRLVAGAAKALGMDIVAYDPYFTGEVDGVKKVDSLDELFASSDYITLHAPLNDSTKNTICADTLAKCRDGVRIVNLARGGLVNSADIIAAVESSKCGGYVTDFPSKDMVKVNGITAIPHLGASTPESEENCAVMAAKQTADYLENGNVVNSVNLPCISKDGKHDRVCVITCGDIAGKVAEALGTTDCVSAVRGEVGYVIADGAKNASALEGMDGVIAFRAID